MSLLIFSFDVSSDKIGEHLCKTLNDSVPSNYPHTASFCSSVQLFSSTTNDFEKLLNNSLKEDLLSHNDLLGFIILIDIATTNALHIKHLPSITSLLLYLHTKHPFQQILTFLIHASPTNQLYTSALTCFNFNLIFYHIYPYVHGVIFNNIDQVDIYSAYHSSIALRIASIFLPVTSLREDEQRTNKSVCTEFLQFTQHLLCNPNKKLLIMFNDNAKKYLNKSSHATLLIQRGKPSLITNDIKLKNFDVWNSLETNHEQLQTTLIINNDQFNNDILERIIVRPCKTKMHTNDAYLYWLRKKFDVRHLEDKLNQGIQLCECLISDHSDL